jgi:hypothetical protein
VELQLDLTVEVNAAGVVWAVTHEVPLTFRQEVVGIRWVFRGKGANAVPKRQSHLGNVRLSRRRRSVERPGNACGSLPSHVRVHHNLSRVSCPRKTATKPPASPVVLPTKWSNYLNDVHH